MSSAKTVGNLPSISDTTRRTAFSTCLTGRCGMPTRSETICKRMSARIWDTRDNQLTQAFLEPYVRAHLGHAAGVLVIDETGFLKKGEHSVGVQRQYSGTAGRIQNCQVGVFLGYATPKGQTLIDRALYLPDGWANDAKRREKTKVPEAVAFATKPQLAQQMLARGLDNGLTAA